jgi:hypothetical protein
MKKPKTTGNGGQSAFPSKPIGVRRGCGSLAASENASCSVVLSFELGTHADYDRIDAQTV